MSRWRIVVVVILILFPMLFLAGTGSYYLWQSGWSLLIWWGLLVCVMVGYFLAAHWLRHRSLLHPIEFKPSEVSTERDQRAWEIVANHAKAPVNTEELDNPDHYWQIAQTLTRELAAHYHPRQKDPLGGLTLPEMLAVVELAAHDLGELVDSTIPGGHLLTLRDMQRARQAVEWYQTASKAWWLVSAFFTPLNTAARFAASQIGIERPLQIVQENLIAWFHAAFVQRVGFYLIELYSGRLRVGTKRWRELVRQEQDEPRVVSLAIMGQVKAGKSSLINAIFGENKARTDVLPATNAVTRYHLASPGLGAHLVLADTQGYGHEGPKADQLEATAEAARQADVLFVVTHAKNPARQADVTMLQALRKWFTDRPNLKRPPILAVLTHIDLLSPSMEWQPPYDWQQGERPKESSIREAVEAAREQLGDLVEAILPVSVKEGKVFGIEEGVLPALTTKLDEARVVAVLRCLRNEPDEGKIRKVFAQLAEAGKGLWRSVVNP